MKELSTKQKVAQMFIVGIPNKNEIPNVINLIKNYPIGGVLLYKNNYSSLEEMQELINNLKKANKDNPIPLWIGLDQEGGRVNRLPNELTNLISAHKLSKKDPKYIKLSAKTISELLYNLGINLNLAPVLDLKINKNNHAIGDRAYSKNPDDIIKITNIIIKEYKNNNILPVIKHFPGQGNLKMDSHILPPKIYDYDNILKKDILPFENAIKNNIDAIMIGHIIIKNKTNLLPASISKNFINNELIAKYNYKGLIITDELSMRSIRYLYRRNYAIKKAFYANNDIILYKYHKNTIEKSINHITNLVNKNKLNIDYSYEKIINIKKKYNCNDNINNYKIDIEKFNKTIKKINES